MRSVIVALTALAAAGCHLVHERPGPDGPTADARAAEDGAVRDARGVDALAADAVALDASACAAPGPLSDPDLGAGARPSDYPVARGWRPPPALAADEPCCTVGAVTSFDSPFVALAHDGERFVAIRRPLTFELDTHFLDPTGAPSGAPVVMPIDETDFEGIRFAEGRWSEVRAAGGVSERFRILDRSFTAVTPWWALDPLIHALQTDHLTVGNRWVGAMGGDGFVDLSFFDECGLRAPARVPLPGRAEHVERPVLVAARSRLVLAWFDQRQQATIAVLQAGEPQVLVGSFPLEGPLDTMDASATPAHLAVLRDTVLRVGVSRSGVAVRAIDPFAASVGPATRVGALRYPLYATIDIAASSTLGLAAVCFGQSFALPTGWQAIDSWVALIDEHGALVGAPVALDHDYETRTTTPGPGCHVAADDTGFLVELEGRVRRVEPAR